MSFYISAWLDVLLWPAPALHNAHHSRCDIKERRPFTQVQKVEGICDSTGVETCVRQKTQQTVVGAPELPGPKFTEMFVTEQADAPAYGTGQLIDAACKETPCAPSGVNSECAPVEGIDIKSKFKQCSVSCFEGIVGAACVAAENNSAFQGLMLPKVHHVEVTPCGECFQKGCSCQPYQAGTERSGVFDLVVDVERTTTSTEPHKCSGPDSLKSCSSTNLTGDVQRCLVHCEQAKQPTSDYVDETRDERCECVESNLSCVPDRKNDYRCETTVNVLSTGDNSRDERCEYHEQAKCHSDVVGTEHAEDFIPACGSDHHICIAPEAEVFGVGAGLTGGGGCHDGPAESEGGKFMVGAGPVAGPECVSSVSQVPGSDSGVEEALRAHAVNVGKESCQNAPITMQQSCVVGTAIEVDHQGCLSKVQPKQVDKAGVKSTSASGGDESVVGKAKACDTQSYDEASADPVNAAEVACECSQCTPPSRGLVNSFRLRRVTAMGAPCTHVERFCPYTLLIEKHDYPG